MTRRVALAALPSNAVAYLRPQAAPVPVKIIDIALPGCQFGRFTISCTTTRISVKAFHELAGQLTFELCVTRAAVNVRRDGSADVVNGMLLSAASPAICKPMLNH